MNGRNDKTPRTVTTHSEAETESLAMGFATTLRPGSVIALSGDLGAGKTCFVRGLCRGLGVSETVLSPTFSLLNIYKTGRMPVYHLDVYRLRTPAEAFDIGLEELLGGAGVCVIEWAEKISDLLPADTIRISMAHAGGDERTISAEG